MVYASLRRSLRSKSLDAVLKSIPRAFTLNTGHVTFFYGKLAFLDDRYQRLQQEQINRGVDIDPNRNYDLSEFPKELFGNYTMTEVDRKVILDRIIFRHSQRPTWYRYHGDSIDPRTYKLLVDYPG